MDSVSDQEKTKQPFHNHKGIRFQAIPVSPAVTRTPLQMICFFDQTLNQVMEGGTMDVDEHFHGAIRELRAKDHFRGEFLETLVITPKDRQIAADKLLLIGLGDPNQFSYDRLKILGRVIINEAVKLKVSSAAFAPDIRDAGIHSFPAREVAVALARGMLRAVTSAIALAEQGLIPKIELAEVILLAGTKHVLDAQAGLRDVLG